MRIRSRPDRGFTFIEVTIVLVMSSTLMLAAIQAFRSSDDMVQDARVRTRAEAQHRRDVQAISNFLRGADIHTLTGFDTNGIATEPGCARVTGADLLERTFGPQETIRWTAYAQDVDGIGRAGTVRAESVAGIRVLADRVPEGGFRVRQEGSNLVVELTTYWRTRAGRSLTVSGSTVVAMRNRE